MLRETCVEGIPHFPKPCEEALASLWQKYGGCGMVDLTVFRPG